MKITTTIAALLFCTAALASSPHKYRLVWQDHFDGITYDNLSWSKIPRGNADWKRYMSDADSLYAVRDGRLVLRGAVNTHRDADTARYVTGGLYTKQRFGKEGTPERAEAEERAYTFYTGAIIEDARKKAKISKAELARRLGTDRAYITRIESGQIEPKVSTFYRIAAALGCTVGLISPIG